MNLTVFNYSETPCGQILEDIDFALNINKTLLVFPLYSAPVGAAGRQCVAS